MEITQEEMKHNIFDWARDVSVAVESFSKDIKFGTKKSTAEADLKEAKSSAKKLIEKIDEYFETLKPKFKVGDYVVEQNGDVISKIEEVINGDFWGTYYKKQINFFGNLGALIYDKDIERYATPTEILEYEMALAFHKLGRKPFEVKEGDLIEYPTGQNIMIYHPDCFSKTDFLNDGFKLIKTAEEVNEWLGADDDK